MEPITLTEIPFQPDDGLLRKALHIRPNTSGERLLPELIDEAAQIAQPKAAYVVAPVEVLDDTRVIIGEEHFTSKLLAMNLQDVNRVFAYVATCGRELFDWEKQQERSLSRFYAYTINNFALYAAMEALHEELTEQFKIGQHAEMNPGSLEDWPIQEQQPLFRVLGNIQESIGVELTKSFIMLPAQAVSGVLFETERDYVNCSFCPNERCPNRRAPYQEGLYAKLVG